MLRHEEAEDQRRESCSSIGSIARRKDGKDAARASIRKMSIKKPPATTPAAPKTHPRLAVKQDEHQRSVGRASGGGASRAVREWEPSKKLQN